MIFLAAPDAFAVLQSKNNEEKEETPSSQLVGSQEPAPKKKRSNTRLAGQGKMTFNLVPKNKPAETAPVEPPAEGDLYDLVESKSEHPLAVEPEDASPVVKQVSAPYKKYTRPRRAQVLDPGKATGTRMRLREASSG